MLLYDWTWWGHLTNQKEGCVEGCMEVFQRGGGEKNKDFMLIRFLNAAIWLDVVGTLNQSEGGVCGGVHGGFSKRWWGKKSGFYVRFLNAAIWLDVEGTLNQSEGGVCRGVHGGLHGGCMEGCAEGRMEGCAEGLPLSNHKFSGW